MIVGELMARVGLDKDKFDSQTDEVKRDFSGIARAAAGIGAVGMGGAVAGLATLEGSSATLQAQLGLTGDEAEDLRDTALDVFGNAFVGSMGEATQAVATMRQATGKQGDELDDLTTRALKVSDVFGQDFNQVVDAARANAASMGTDFDTALNTITKGMQSGLNISDDFLDTVREYSPSFDRIGQDSGRMLATLQTGLDLGIRDTDRMADSINEFGVRMSEAGGTAETALAEMTGNADEARNIMAEFAKGGESAAGATQKVVEGLFEIDDPMKRTQLGVQLFGTMWEDTSGKVGEALLQAQGSTVELEGATDSLDAKYGTTMSTLNKFKRQVQISVLEPLSGVGPVASTAVQGLGSIGTAALGIQALGLGGMFTRVWGTLKAGIPIIRAVGLSMKTALISSGIGLVVVALGLLVMHWDKVWPALKAAWDTFLGWIMPGVEAFTGFITGAWEGIKSAVIDTWNAVWGPVQSIFETVSGAVSGIFDSWWAWLLPGGAFIKALFFMKDNWREIWGTIQDVFSTVSGTIQGGFESFRDVVMPIWTTLTGNVREAWDTLWNAIKTVFNTTFGALQSGLSAYIRVFELVWGKFLGGITAGWSAIWDTVERIFGAVTGSVERGIGTFRDTFIGAWDAIESSVRGVANSIAGIINSIISAIEKMINAMGGALNKLPSFSVPSWVPGIGGNEFGIPDIPRVSLPKVPTMDTGGIVQGPGLFAVGAGVREIVRAPEGSGSKDVHVTQNFYGDTNPSDQARRQERAMRRLALEGGLPG